MRTSFLLMMVLQASIAYSQEPPNLSSVGQFVFLKEGISNKNVGDQFTAEQRGLPSQIEAVERDRVRVHGVWLRRDEVLDINQTIDQCTKVLSGSPMNTSCLLRRGMAFHLDGQFKKALEDYTTAIDIDDECTKAYECRGVARFARLLKEPVVAPNQEIDAAIGDISQAIRLAPADPHLWIERGDMWHFKKEVDAAIGDYAESIRLDPDVPNAYCSRAKCWEEKGDSTAAIRDYTQAIAIDNSMPKVFVSRGRLRRLQKEYDEAIEDYTNAIRLDKSCMPAFLGRGMCLHALKRIDDAIADYTEVVRNDPKGIEAFQRRGEAFCALGQFDDAIDDLNRVVALAPNRALAFYNRGVVLSRQRKFAEAITDFTESLRLDPSHAGSYLARGTAYDALKEYAGAVRDYEDYVRLKPKDRRIVNRLAWTYATCPTASVRDGAKAVELARRSCELSGWKDAEDIDTLGAAYAEAGDWENAIRNQKRAVEMTTAEREKTDRRYRLALYAAKEAFRSSPPSPID